MPKSRAENTQSGFTLIEVIVALAIAALGLTMLVVATGTGLTNATAAAETIEATERAQSHLDALGRLTALRPGVQFGDDGGGYSWRVAVSEPVAHAIAGSADETPPRSGNPVAMTLTRRLRKRLARPITAFCSCRMLGMPSSEAATSGGTVG